MATVILFVFGVIVGSFLNVLGLRWNSGLSLGGRSFCPVCGKKLCWHELIPVLSFVFLHGRCLQCKARISYQYPMVEILTGLIFATVPYIFIPVFCIYIVIGIYDIRHKIIPNSLVYASIALSLIVPLFIVHYSFLDWLAGPILFSFFALVWLISRGKAMGFGDAKLGLSVGLLLGAASGFSAVVLAFWVGAAIGITYMIFSPKKITIKSEMPFAPFIIFGSWLALILNLDLLHVSFF